MEPIAAISLVFSVGFCCQCLYSCNLYYGLNRMYDRLDVVEQILWSSRQQTVNPVFTIAPECNRIEDPE